MKSNKLSNIFQEENDDAWNVCGNEASQERLSFIQAFTATEYLYDYLCLNTPGSFYYILYFMTSLIFPNTSIITWYLIC